jgi:hypothetical protein
MLFDFLLKIPVTLWFPKLADSHILSSYQSISIVLFEHASSTKKRPKVAPSGSPQ